MTHRKADYIDQLLQSNIASEEQDMLHVELMNAIPKPRREFVEALGERLDTYADLELRTKKKHQFRLLGSVRWGLVAVLVFIVFTGIIFAANNLIQQVINQDSGLSSVWDAGLGIEPNLSQTVGDFTVEIPWIYADESRISIGYIITANTPEPYYDFRISEVQLTDSSNHSYPINPEGFIVSDTDQTAGQLTVDVSQSETMPAQLALQLRFQVEYSSTERRTGLPQPSSLREWYSLSDPFEFQFIIPVNNGYSLQTNLTTNSTDIPMSLREFVVAPSGGYAIVCYPVPDHPRDQGWEWTLTSGTLSYDDRSSFDVQGGRYDNETGCSRIVFNDSMPLEAGVWRLTILEISGTRTRLPDENVLRATVEAVGGSLLDTEDAIDALELPEGGLEAIGLEERIEGQWTYTIEIPPELISSE